MRHSEKIMFINLAFVVYVLDGSLISHLMAQISCTLTNFAKADEASGAW
jgi:hypothetical protein